MDKLDSVISEDETVFCIRMRGEDVELFIQSESEEEISSMLAVFVERSLNNHPDEGSCRAGRILLDAVDMAVWSRLAKMRDESEFPMVIRQKSDLSAN